MKERIGQLFENKTTKTWVARVAYKNTNGKKTAIQNTADTEEEAKKLLKKLIDKVENGGRKDIEDDKMTFNDLADYYEGHYAKPAKFVDDRKIEGLRNYKRIKGFLKNFRAYF